MDARQFDAITRMFRVGADRRRVLGVLLGGLAAVLGSRRATEAQGNSDCAHFCKEVFPPGRERGQCVRAAARGDAGNLCAACGADPANICTRHGGGHHGDPVLGCLCIVDEDDGPICAC
jgi:hypothetical protein